jgi:transposase
MISFSSKQRYFLYRGVTDMRKSFTGLCGVVNNEFTHPLRSRDIFIFINKRKNQIKLLMWDVTGFAIYYKKLERGTFELPAVNEEKQTMELSWRDVVFLLEGVQFKSVKMRKRYSEVS